MNDYVGLLASTSDVWTQYYDGTGWSSASITRPDDGVSWNNQALVVLLGMLTPVYAFVGYEAAGHMSEETKDAATSSPWGIIYTALASGLVGLAFVLSLTYSVAGDLDGFLNNSGGTVSVVFQQCAGIGFGNLLTGLLMMGIFFNGISSFTVTTRISYAMARDGAFPGSRYIAYVVRCVLFSSQIISSQISHYQNNIHLHYSGL